MRNTLLIVVILSFGLLTASCKITNRKEGQHTRKPNIVYILADVGYGELGCFGQEKIETPHIDKLAENGVLFTHFYTPRCFPSRASLLTGLYPHQAGVGHLDED